MPAMSLKYELTQFEKKNQQIQNEIHMLKDMLQSTDSKMDSEQRLINLILQNQRESALQEQNLSKMLEKLQESQRNLLKAQESLVDCQNTFDKKQMQIHELLRQASNSFLESQKKSSERSVQIYKNAQEADRYSAEAVWAHIFNNSISGSSWLKDKTFSPGRWAVGYPYLYAMYRVLNEIRPNHILELGLGQSTRMITQYAAAFEKSKHIVVEHDPSWIEFMSRELQLSRQTHLVQMELEMTKFENVENVRVYKGFGEKFGNQKFDFISIDAPLGGDMYEFARIDVLRLLPDCLMPDFVIMIDDTERSGEQHTIVKMEEVLQRNGIPYKKGRYVGKKDCMLICSETLSFLATM